MKYVITALEKVRDVIKADSPEAAEKIFRALYPATVKILELDAKMVNDKPVVDEPSGMSHANNMPLMEISREEWAKDNAGYIDENLKGKITMKDPRQKFFNEAVEAISSQTDNVQANDRENLMPASAVDLGRLQDTIMDLMKKKEVLDEKDIENFIVSSVQRPKQIKVEPWQDDFNKCTRYKITLVTKDDYGYYTYGFNTRLLK